MSDPITPNKLRTILALPPDQAEPALFHRLRELDDTAKYSYGEIGQICHQVEAKSLWKERSSSFAAWLREACPWGFSTAFAAMRDVESLQDMPVEAVAKIPASNFHIVKQMSTAVRNDPQVIQAMQTQDTEGLTEYVRANHPDQHIERKLELRVKFTESAYERVLTVIKRAEIRGATSWAEAVEAICVEAEASWDAEDAVLEIAARLGGKKEYVQ